MKPVSDGAAFNRLLCLSQLCYVMASNTWANTLEMPRAPKVKTGVQLCDSRQPTYQLG